MRADGSVPITVTASNHPLQALPLLQGLGDRPVELFTW